MNKVNLIQKINEYLGEIDESKILISIIEKPLQGATEISRNTGIERTKVYRSLEALKKRFLIEEILKDTGRRYVFVGVEGFERLLNEREEDVKNLRNNIGKLKSDIFNIETKDTSNFLVKHYKEDTGLRQMLWNQLSSSNKRILAFSYKDKNAIVGKDFAEKLRAEQKKRGIQLYEIENHTHTNNYYYTDVAAWEKVYTSIYLPEKILKIRQYISIYSDTVAIVNWIGNEKIGIEITNKNFAQMQKSIFWEYWRIAEGFGKASRVVKKNVQL